MKKSFTLKAFAFGAFAALGLTAAAAAPQAEKAVATLQPAFADVAPQLQGTEQMQASFRINPQLVKASADNARKVSAHRATPSYGDWTDGGDMEVTYNMIWNMPHKQSTTYQIRQDNANEGEFQVKIAQFTEEDCDLILTVQSYQDGYIVFTDPNGVDCNFTIGDGSGNEYECYYADHYHWLVLRKNFGLEISDADLQSWYDFCEYDPETGEFIMGGVYYPEMTAETQAMSLPWYVTNAAGTAIESYKFDYFRRLGGDYKNYDYTLGYNYGYFSHEKNAKTGTFTMPIELNDNGDLYIGMFKSLTATTAKNYFQNILAVVNGEEGATLPTDIVKITAKDGLIELPLTLNDPYVKGAKKILFVLLFKDNEYLKSNYNPTSGLSNITVQLTADDVDYYSVGNAEYKDVALYDMLPWVFGLEEDGWEGFVDEMANMDIEVPEEYVVTVPLQESTANPGKYRLVHPYYEYYNDYLTSMLYYDAGIDYLNLNIPTADEVTVLQSNNGFYWNTNKGTQYCFSYGSVNQYTETEYTASANCYGTLADGKITFPTPQYDGNGTGSANVVAPLGWLPVEYNVATGVAATADKCEVIFDSDLCYIKGNFTPAAGVNTVAADVENNNAPVEYFNLLGVRVANPEAGQLLIKRQGSQVEKVVIR